MTEALRDAEREKVDKKINVESWTEIGGGVLLGVVAQPIHEGAHAVVTRLLTGLWPHVGFWAVYPVSQFSSKLDAAIVLAAGDLAVLGWWAVIFLLVRQSQSTNGR